jgi:hypothetical protein
MSAMSLRPAVAIHGSAKSSFRGMTASFQQLSVAPVVARTAKLQVEGEMAGLGCRVAAAGPWARGLRSDGLQRAQRSQ